MQLGEVYLYDSYTWSFALVLLCFFASIIASVRVRTTYSKYNKKLSSRGLTAERAAAKILQYYGITDVEIVPIRGKLTDNFNPKTKQISLSESVWGSSSIGAIGVACHEAGHAAQHAQGYVPIKIRNSIVPVCNFGSMAGIPIALVGVCINSETLALFGILLYSLIAVFQFVTLPVEFDASKRALKVIRETNVLTEDEVKGAGKVLRAAAMTYVVALASSLADLLRFAVIILGSRRSSD